MRIGVGNRSLDVRPFENNKYNIILVYFVSYNFSIFFSRLNELRTMVHRCNSLSRNVPRAVPRNNRTVSVVRHQVVATAAIDTVALSAICTRTVWSVKAYNNNYYYSRYTFLLRLLYSCLFAVLQCKYILFFISFVVASRVLSVPAVAFALLYRYIIYDSRPTSTYASIRLRL